MIERTVVPKKSVCLRLPSALYEQAGHRALIEGLGHRPSLVVEKALREYLVRCDHSQVRQSALDPSLQ